MASKMCLDAVRNKVKEAVVFSFSSLRSWRNFSSAAAATSQQLLASSSSGPMLMLPPEDAVRRRRGQRRRVVNLRYFNPANREVVKLKNRKLPQPLSNACCVGSSRGWLAYLNRRDCGFYLVNFFSSPTDPKEEEEEEITTMIPLPSVKTLPCVVHARYDKSHPSRIKYFTMYDFTRKLVNWYTLDPPDLAANLVRRMALSCAPNYDDKNSCTVVVIIHEPQGELAFCRLRGGGGGGGGRGAASSSSSWNRLDSPLPRKQGGKVRGFSDVVYSNKEQLFYALLTNSGGKIEAWDLREEEAPPKRIEIEDIDYIVPPPEESKRGLALMTNELDRVCVEYLVESPEGDILRIRRHRVSIGGGFVNYTDELPYGTVGFEVWKVDFEGKKGEYLDDLGDTVVFLGELNHSFAVSVRDCPELNPNSIYFNDHYDASLYRNHAAGANDDDAGIFSLKDGFIKPFYPSELQPYPPELQRDLMPSIWVAPNP